MDVKNNVLETIGNTPLIKLNKSVEGVEATVLAKVETFNPGHSIKDRMALKMVEEAEANGWISPGGTFIECTSGNTGMGIALAAAVKGYKCIFTTNDKQSKEKLDMLRALGAEVIVCPTDVRPNDPKSYYSVAEKLSRETENSYWLNQYDNLANRRAHYESTGPEIWEQTEGKITHLVVGVGTGGTISGTAKYLKEQNPGVKIWAIDTFGSVLKKFHETGEFDESEIYPYITEGIGEDIVPKNIDFSLIDHFEKVSDKDGALAARALAREEGLLLGYSAGSALAGLIQLRDQLSSDDVVVLIFHDHGSRYVGKIYNDDWMRDRGFLDKPLRVKDLVGKKENKNFITIEHSDVVKDAIQRLKENDISQMPVMKGEAIVGSVTEGALLKKLFENFEKNAELKIAEVMNPPFPEISPQTKINEVNRYISRDVPAVIIRDRSGEPHVITQYDIIQSI